MSMLGIGSSILQAFSTHLAQNAQEKFHHVQSEFQQLGQDLQSGNLTKAQQDYATLAKNIPSAQQTANSPLAQDLGALAQALQSGNLTTAQQAYATLRQDVQQGFSLVQNKLLPHHSPQVDTQNSAPTQQNNNSLQQIFNQLGAALQSGSNSPAYQAYSTIQQDLPQFASSGSFGSSSTLAQTGRGSLNVNV